MRSRTRLIAVIASLLVCIAMIGTGFASWVILAAKSAESEGNVKAEAVSNEGNLTFELVNNGDQNIYFGGPAEQTNDKAWLISDGASGNESLTATFELNIVGSLKEISISVEVPANYKTAVDAGYLAAPTMKISATSVTFNSGTDITLSADTAGTTYTATAKITSSDEGKEAGHKFTGTTDHVTVTFTFGWGTNFDSKNPYEYFNDDKTVNGTDITAWNNKTGMTSPTTWGDVANQALTQLNTWFPETSSSSSFEQYKVTFSATAATIKDAE